MKKAGLFKLSEFLAISALAVICMSKLIYFMLCAMKIKPRALDNWFMCYSLQYQAQRISCLDLGNLWRGGFFYPFHDVSLLFDAPSFGISLLITPVWMITGNIFSIFRLGGVFAIYLTWILTYYFLKNAGCKRSWAFSAGALFCFCGSALILINGQYGFWSFFMVPLLGILTLKIFSAPKVYWGILWGVVLGYLAWSSAHVFVMGGLFILLFALWQLKFNCSSQKSAWILLAGLMLAGIIAGIILGPMYFTHQRFGFYRYSIRLYEYASNFPNLIYRHWPAAPLNPMAKTHFGEYIKSAVKGETNIGLSIIFLLTAATAFVIRLSAPVLSRSAGKHSFLAGAGWLSAFALLAFLNMRALLAKSIKWDGTVPDLAVGTTYACYIIAGLIIYFLRRRIKAALKHLDFFLLLCALLFGFLAFGPYYLIKGGRVIAAPVAFLQYHVPGFSGIQATARWGLIMAFALSLAVAVFLSRYLKTAKQKIFAGALMFIALLEVSPGFRLPDFKHYAVYQWSPRPTDIFLKNLPGQGAVLEMRSYPVERKQQVTSDNDLGYVLFSSLYHKKPLVTGYSSYQPHVINKYLFYPKENKFSSAKIANLRKFGAQYWVVHIEGWPQEEVQTLTRILTDIKFKKLTELDNGQTLIYEDPEPKVSLGYYDIKKTERKDSKRK